jgi:hypothetical protein
MPTFFGLLFFPTGGLRRREATLDCHCLLQVQMNQLCNVSIKSGNKLMDLLQSVGVAINLYPDVSI